MPCDIHRVGSGSRWPEGADKGAAAKEWGPPRRPKEREMGWMENQGAGRLLTRSQAPCKCLWRDFNLYSVKLGRDQGEGAEEVGQGPKVRASVKVLHLSLSRFDSITPTSPSNKHRQRDAPHSSAPIVPH